MNKKSLFIVLPLMVGMIIIGIVSCQQNDSEQSVKPGVEAQLKSDISNYVAIGYINNNGEPIINYELSALLTAFETEREAYFAANHQEADVEFEETYFIKYLREQEGISEVSDFYLAFDGYATIDGSGHAIKVAYDIVEVENGIVYVYAGPAYNGDEQTGPIQVVHQCISTQDCVLCEFEHAMSRTGDTGPITGCLCWTDICEDCCFHSVGIYLFGYLIN